jgi:cobalt-zinc-cadmium efflux system protein
VDSHATAGGPHRRRAARLGVAFAVGAAVMAAEVAAGLAANSLVLLADAAHYAADLGAVGLALLAVLWSTRSATPAKTFGYRRAEVVAAFLNAVALWIVSAYFVWHAYQRLLDPPPVEGPLVLITGALTLVANLGLAALLHGHAHDDLNQRAAYLHVVGDALGSGAAIVAGALVAWKGWTIADPLLTLFVSVLLVVFTWRLTRQTLHILLEGTPMHLDSDDVEAALRAVPGVRDLHDLHVWTIASGAYSLTVHIVLGEPPKDDAVLQAVHSALESRFQLRHLTVQVEGPDSPCAATHEGLAA